MGLEWAGGRLHFFTYWLFIFSCYKGPSRIWTSIFSFSSLDSFCVTLHQHGMEPEHAPVVWNSLTSTASNILECAQSKFSTVCYNTVSKNHSSYSC
jgi:hypothetical protein